ncbi:MAG: flippase-like domain-containing protein [Spirochaetia bacterium]
MGRDSQPAAPEARRNSGLPVAYIVFALMLAALATAVVLEWNKAQPALRQANWHMLTPALLFTFVSLFLACVAYALINRAFGLLLPTGRLLLVGFVNMTANNLITLGGAAGSTVSMVLLRRKDGVVHDVLAASLFNSYLHLGLGALVLPPSVLYLMFLHELSALTRLAGAVVFLVSLAIAIVVNLAALLRPIRSRIIRLLSRFVNLVSRKDLSRTFAEFDSSLTEGLALLAARPRRLALLLTCHLGTWVVGLVALWFCFAALGHVPPTGIMISGYFVALAAGSVSMIPGGLGIQDGSMAGIYAMLGTPLEIAVLAAILFRVVYYLLPFVIGLVIYWSGLRRRSGEKRSQGTDESVIKPWPLNP